MNWIAAGHGLSLKIPNGDLAGDTPPDRIIRVGEGSQDLPAPVLPQTGRAVPALTQTAPPDVINGWVRLWIAGYLAGHPHWDGVICAQHEDVSHWLQVSADEVVSCKSFVTPRLIAALGGAEHAAPEAVSDSMSRPERIAAHLRVAEISGSAAHVTGHLIGAELAAARPYWLGQQVVVIGEARMMATYGEALTAQGGPVICAERAHVLPRGLAALATALQLPDR